MRNVVLFLFFLLTVRLDAQWIAPNPVAGVQRLDDGALLKLEKGFLRVQVCNDSILHVVYSLTETVPSRAEYVVTRTAWPAAKWTLQDSQRVVTISTDRMRYRSGWTRRIPR